MDALVRVLQDIVERLERGMTVEHITEEGKLKWLVRWQQPRVEADSPEIKERVNW